MGNNDVKHFFDIHKKSEMCASDFDGIRYVLTSTSPARTLT